MKINSAGGFQKAGIFFVLIVLLMLCLGSLNTSQAATPLYVNGTSGNDSWDGTSPVYVDKDIGPLLTINTGVNKVDDGGTINVAEGNYAENLIISKNLNLIGTGQNLTYIDGKSLGSVITISSGFNVQIINLTIYNGASSDGGGIYNDGTIVINTSNINQNVATGNGGAIYNSGRVEIYNSNFEENQAGNVGGAIFNTASATLNIENSTFHANIATGSGSWGGAICNDGTVIINNSQFIENIAEQHGGAISNSNGVLTVSQSIFSHNDALSGAILNYYGTVNAHYNYIVGNAAPDFYNAAGTFNAEYNWWGQNTGPGASQTSGTVATTPWLYMTLTAPSLMLNGSTSQLNASFNNAYNGSTVTPIDPAGGHLPDGCNVTFNTDFGNFGIVGQTTTKTTSNGLATATLDCGNEIGFAHVSARLDSQNNTATIRIHDNNRYVNVEEGNNAWDGTSPIYIEGTTTGPMETIQAAINAVETGGTVNVAEGIYSEHITVNKSMYLIGENQDTTVIDGQNSDQPLYAVAGTINLLNFTIQNGSAENGGGINNWANLTIINCKVISNTATNNGGGIYTAGNLTVNNSIITGNSAGSRGGGIFAYDFNPIIRYSTLTNNSAAYGREIFGMACTADARYNWWGSNSGPQNDQANIGTIYSPWLYMTFSATPNFILNGETSLLNVNFNNAYNGTNLTPLNPASGHIPDGSIVTFTTDLGSVGSKTTTKTTSNGIATATLTANEGKGTAHVSAQMDSQLLNSTVGIETLYVNGATGNDTWDGTSPIWISGIIGPMKTIQTAINAINSGGTINVASGTYNEHLTIAKSLNLIGASQVQTIISGTNNGRVLYINSGYTVNITNFSIINGSSTSGGAIYNQGTLQITNSNLTNNTATFMGGGAIYNDNGTVTVSGCSLTNNTATGPINGGAIYNYGGTVTVNNSKATNNTAQYGGFLFNNWAGMVTVTYNTLSNNIAYSSGSVIFNNGGTVIDATYNWWGQNTGPLSGQIFGTVNYSPWLYMTLTANPTLILNGSTSQLNASFNNAYNGNTLTPIDPATGHLPDGCPVIFTTDLGNVGSKTTVKNTTNGVANANLTADEGVGTAHVSAQLDNQLLNSTVGIETLYVNGATGNNTWDGTSPTWINGTTTGPMKTIITALNAINSGGTINIASGVYTERLTIGKNLNLIGAGQDLTIIDGLHVGTVIILSSGMNVNITGVTILNGTAPYGGGIYNYGTLTLNNSKVTANYASITGGGIRNDGTMKIFNCNVTGNTAVNAAGIINFYGTMAINNTNITGNIASGNIGAIYNNVATLIITNSTISGNSASAMGGAINNLNGGVIVNYCRILNNSPTNIDNSGGTVDASYNWWGSNTGPTGTVGTVNTSQWLYMTLTANPTCIIEGTTSTLTSSLNNAFNGTHITAIDPEVGHLPDGSNVTFTTDLGSVGSKTTTKNTSNGIATATLTADEGKGTAHISAQIDNQILNGTVGIETLYVNVSTGNDTWDGTNPTHINGTNNGPMRIIQTAINSINSGGTINVAPGTYREHLSINKNLNIIGAGQDLTIIDGNNMGTVIRINSGNVNITGVTIQNGSSSIGCGIYNSGFLTLNNSKLTGNNAGLGDGGAIYNNGGSLNINNSTITGNTANHGAGIYNMGGNVTITNSTLHNNTVSSTAGGIFNGDSGYVTVHYCRILNNTPNNIDNTGGTVDASYNWWGSNSGPTGTVGTVNTSPWLYMTFTTNPALILNGATSTLNVSLNNAYNGTTITPIDPATGHIPNGCPVTFTTDLGSVGSKTTTKNTINGIATAILTANEGVGTAHVSAELDNQLLNSTVGIETLYVNGATGNDTWDGTNPTWINGTTTGPMKTITTALNAINSDGTVNVASGVYTERFTIGKNLNLVGAGQDLTLIDGTHGGVVITVSSGKNVNVTGVTILNGTSTYGGGIYNYGTLTLNKSKVTANYASTSGGGIRNDGTMNIFNCNITGNSGLNAGGAVNSGTMVINNTNITGNTASSNMGGVYNNAGTLTITNSTITGNTALTGGVIHSSGGTVIVHYCSIVNNSPYNVYAMSGTIEARNNWWGSNSGSTGTYGSVIAGNWLYMTFNANPSFILNGETSQLTADFNNICNGVTVTPIDPVNGHLPDGRVITFGTNLGNVGGSKTNTQTTSNGIATATLTADEGIGFANVYGSLDNQNLTSIIRIHDNNRYVNGATGNNTWDGTSPIHIDGTSTGPMQTIQTAINAVETGGNVNVAIGIYNELLTIGKNLNLLGVGPNESIIDGSGLSTLITITGTPNVNITGLTIRNSSYGGGIVTDGAVIINNSIITNNTKGGFGGGIENWGALTIINSFISGNSVSFGFGGAIYNTGILNIINSTLNGNTAIDGGAICNEGGGAPGDEGILNIINSTITNNTASRNGGAIYNSGTEITITNSTITKNTASTGGSIYNLGGTSFTMHYNRIADNTPNTIWNSRTINAEYNWWGSNSNPSSQFTGTGTVNYSPWLYMTFTANPAFILTDTTSQLTVDFNNICNGVTVTPIDPVNGHLPDGSIVTFGTDLGNVGSKTTIKNTTNGIATATLTADEGIGFAHVSGTLDNQNFTSTIRIHDNNRYVNAATGNDAWDGTNPTYINGTNTGPMQTIPTAMTAVETGGNVNVASGTYTGNLNINKVLNLLGEGLVILNPVSTISGITITNAGSGSTVRGFNITVSGSPSSTGAIYLNGANYCNITGNYVSGYWAGIYVYTGSKWNNISNNTVIGNQNGIRIVGSGTENNIIYGNTISQNTQNGIYLTTVPVGTIVNFNRIANNTQYGIYTMGATLNAEYNWWGDNGSPESKIFNFGLVDYSPWIYMTFNVSSDLILNGTTSNLTADFNNAYEGSTVTPFDPANGHLPDASTVIFTTDLGSVGSKSIAKNTINGIATARLIADETIGFANVSGTLDSQNLTSTVNIVRVLNTRTLEWFDSIQEALDDANTINNDVIGVGSGYYPENVMVNKNLTISSPVNANVIALSSSNSVFTIDSAGSGSTIQGFIVSGATGSYGIFLSGSNNCNILNNTLTGNNMGILVLSNYNNITGNNASSNGWAGICLSGVSFNTLSDNLVSGNPEGIYILNSNNNIFNNNLANENIVNGLNIVNGSNNTLLNNIVSNNGVSVNGNGVILKDTVLNNLDGNVVFGNGWSGLVLDNSSHNNLLNAGRGGNTINGNGNGLVLFNGCENNTIAGNKFITNLYNGLELFVNCEYNQIYNNNIMGTLVTGILVQYSNSNNVTGNTVNDSSFNGVALESANNNIIDANNITWSGSIGLILVSSNYNQITANELLSTFWTNIAMDQSSYNLIQGNTINGTGVSENGIWFQGNCNWNNITSNIITENTANGLFIQSSTNNLINNNVISQNVGGAGIGLLLVASSSTVINHNTFQDNGWVGTCVSSDSNGNTITENNYISTTSQVSQAYDAGTNSYDNGTTGNYWNNWGSTSPRPIDGGYNVDNHPSLTQF